MTFWEGEKNKKPDDPGEFDPSRAALEWAWFHDSLLFSVPLWEGGGPSLPLGKKRSLISPSLVANPSWTIDAVGRQLTFNGTDQLEILDGDIYDYILNPFTWIMQFSTTDTDINVRFGGAGNSTDNDVLSSWGNGRPGGGSGFSFLHRDATAGKWKWTGSTTTAHQDGNVHIAIATWDLTTLRVWLDNNELTDTSDALPITTATTFDRRAIGCLRRGVNSLFADCSISLWSEHDRVITTSQRLQITRDFSGPFHMDDQDELRMLGVAAAVAVPTINLVMAPYTPT